MAADFLPAVLNENPNLICSTYPPNKSIFKDILISQARSLKDHLQEIIKTESSAEANQEKQ